MSLLAAGPHSVEVYPEVIDDDGYGTKLRVPGTTPTPVRGWMQPVSAIEAEAAGQQVRTTYRLSAQAVPGGAWARVVWQGREFEVVGEPERHGDGLALAHTTVLLAARGPVV